MLVGELRQRLNAKAGQVAAIGDQEEVAMVMEYARAALITLSQQPDDAEFDLQSAMVDTKTAALILRLHPEHLRYIIRRKQLPAVKENGEYRIALSDLMGMMGSGRSLPSTMTATSIMNDMAEAFPVVLWERLPAKSAE